MSLVRFRLAEQTFALDVMSVREVQRLVRIQTLPALPPEILGVINFHGQVVPVLDLRRRLGLPAAPPTPASPLFILTSRDRLLAGLIDQVYGIVHGVVDELLISPDSGWDCVRGVIPLDEQITTILDADKLPTPALEALLDTQISLVEN